MESLPEVANNRSGCEIRTIGLLKGYIHKRTTSMPMLKVRTFFRNSPCLTMVEANDFSDILGMLLTSFCVLLKQNNFIIIHYHDGDAESEKDDSVVDISIHC